MYFSHIKNVKAELQSEEQALKLFGSRVGFWVTTVQLISGFLLLFSFDKNIRMLYLGEDLLLTSLLVISLVLTIVLCVLLYTTGSKDSTRAFMSSLVIFVLIVGIMGWMRHELRESYLSRI